MDYQKTVLANGVRIVTEEVAHCRTAAVGIWVDVGSRDEHGPRRGCAHFVEHMFFKGTARRSARQIALELDGLGGTANAYTTRESTCFHATVLDRHLPQLVELFSDLFLQSAFAAEEVERERQVILQEFAMVEDTPDELLHDLFVADLWGGHPLGLPVLGDRQAVTAMDSATLRGYVQECYTPERIVIAAAGAVEHDAFVALWQDAFAGLAVTAGGGPGRQAPSQVPPVRKVYRRPFEQLHLVLGTYGVPVDSPDRYIFYLFNVLLGGNMSSRLFQEIRENRGLAYSVASDVSAYCDAGSLTIALGIEATTANQVLGLVASELGRFRREAVSAEELANAKEYVCGGIYLAADNMEARMTRLARNEICYNRFVPLEEVAEAFTRVTGEEIRELADRLLAAPLAGAALGPVKPKQIDWRLLDQ